MAVLLLVSLLPLGVMGAGAWVVFSRLLEDKALELHSTVVQGHARSIDLYLAERLHALDLAARSHRFEELSNQAALERLFDTFSRSYGKSFIDLGVIESDGAHVAYVGPYALKDKNYEGTEWFRHVMSRGDYVSDVFLGFRNVPHCVIAVKQQEGPHAWILRATINSDEFDSLVQTGQIGRTGDAFIVNSRGLYQTPPRLGKVLEQSPITSPRPHRGVRHGRVTVDGATMVRATTWLNDGRWMLVVQQDAAEIEAPVRGAMAPAALVFLAAVVLIVVTTLLATRHLTNQIDQANRERDGLSRDLLRSAKLASLGEMAGGLAHEINNPLAIIGTEQTNIGDLVNEVALDPKVREELLESVQRCKRQVERCGNITTKMLQFGRRTEPVLRLTDVGPRLDEVIQLLRKQAEVRKVDLRLDVAPSLPPLLLDPAELDQVLINLINNSLYAAGAGGEIRVSARASGDGVLIAVADNGRGIAPDDLGRIFQPFFTTKPPGEGTGLGLSVCYGIVHNWGGTIEADSELGKGTVMTIRLPVSRQDRKGRGVS